MSESDDSSIPEPPLSSPDNSDFEFDENDYPIQFDFEPEIDSEAEFETSVVENGPTLGLKFGICNEEHAGQTNNTLRGGRLPNVHAISTEIKKDAGQLYRKVYENTLIKTHES